MRAFDELRKLEIFFKEEARRGCSIVDLYELVQHAGNILPRLWVGKFYWFLVVFGLTIIMFIFVANSVPSGGEGGCFLCLVCASISARRFHDWMCWMLITFLLTRISETHALDEVVFLCDEMKRVLYVFRLLIAINDILIWGYLIFKLFIIQDECLDLSKCPWFCRTFWVKSCFERNWRNCWSGKGLKFNYMRWSNTWPLNYWGLQGSHVKGFYVRLLFFQDRGSS